MDNRSIGLFDSGVGGLTVAAQIMRVLPDESICYMADNDRAPYGGQPPETIARYSKQVAAALIAQDVKAVLVACNTVSAVCLDELRRSFAVPFIGMIEPGVLAALAQKPRSVCLLATEATVSSGLHRRLFQKMDSDIAFYSIACPAFVPIIEAGLADSNQARSAAKSALSALPAPPDVIILGCTHYPFMEGAIRQAAANETRIVNPAYFAARMLRDTLKEAGLLCESGRRARHRIFVSGPPDSCGAVLNDMFAAAERPEIERLLL